jgi:hypothetical protein
MTGREFLIKQCDEKFWEDDLNEEGNRFAQSYYATNKYYGDYEAILSAGLPTLYHVEDSWANFEKISEVLDRRYHEWKSGNAG